MFYNYFYVFIDSAINFMCSGYNQFNNSFRHVAESQRRRQKNADSVEIANNFYLIRQIRKRDGRRSI